tara:strand:+ start:219 stop:449 length:231 start_codon:yes stop_codon:yes gene_type:complete
MFENLKLHEVIQKIILNYLRQCKHKGCIKLGQVNLKDNYFDSHGGFYCKECKKDYIEKRSWYLRSGPCRYYHYFLD